MTRRITRAIVGVAAFVVLLLGIPLALVVHRSILDAAVVSLQSTAAHTLTEISVPISIEQLDALGREPDAPPPFGLYGTDGRLRFGAGPPVGDSAVVAALAGRPATDTTDELVVATPITDQREVVQGVLRLARSRGGVASRTRAAWAIMAASALVALGAAWVLARRLAGQLSMPLTDLAVTAAGLAAGVTHTRPDNSGVLEIDQLAAALHDSAQRITGALVRERTFSENASHQLRTPLAALRLQLEDLAGTDRSAADQAGFDTALRELDRLEGTVQHLLTVARAATPTVATTSLLPIVAATAQRWRSLIGRELRTSTDAAGDPAVRCSAAGIEQILDVLVDNAARHGRGAITLAVRSLAGAVAIDVSDEGRLDGRVALATLFERGHGTDNGIGLALARSLVEAEGGRLTLTDRDPTTFTVHLLDAAAG